MFAKLTIDNEQLTIIGTKDVAALKHLGSTNPPISETVGNGLCAVPRAFLDITRVGKWYHVCRGGKSAACYVQNITRMDERFHSLVCHSDRSEAEWRNPPR